MRNSLAGRLLIAALVAIVIGAMLLAFFHFYAGGQNALTERAKTSAAGDVGRLQSLLADIAGPLRTASLAAAGAAIIAAFGFIIAVEARPPAGDIAAAKWRTPWIVLLFAVWLIAGIVAWQMIAPIDWMFDAGHRTYAYLAIELAATLIYWIATMLGARITARVAVPLGDTLLNR